MPASAPNPGGGTKGSNSSDDDEQYMPEFIVGARRVRGKAVYRVKWRDCSHSEDCDGEISDPSEFLHDNGNELEGWRVVVKYDIGVAPQEGTIVKYDTVTCTHTVLYDDSEEEELDLLAPQKEWRRII